MNGWNDLPEPKRKVPSYSDLWPDGNWLVGKLHTFWDVEQARENLRPRPFCTHLEGELHINTYYEDGCGDTAHDSHLAFSIEELRDLIRTLYTYECANCGSAFTHEDYGDEWPSGEVCAACTSLGKKDLGPLFAE